MQFLSQRYKKKTGVKINDYLMIQTTIQENHWLYGPFEYPLYIAKVTENRLRTPTLPGK